MKRYSFVVLLVVLSMVVAEMRAQRFSVASFRLLPNDVTAFITPVQDLNEEDCGLVKVAASEDFVFSTPLGVVKREDKTGEIWLWLPRGSKKLTIKHADYGVLRDYAFPEKIDSHMTYELRIEEPIRRVASEGTNPVVTTVVDTLVVIRTDTLLVEVPKRRLPLTLYALATFGYGGGGKMPFGGLMLALMKRHGGFVHLSTDFGRIGETVASCDREGFIDGVMPYYSGVTRKSMFMANGGAIHRISDHVAVFEGLGYSTVGLAWGLAESEGGGYVRNRHYCCSGVSAEAGFMLAFGRLSVSGSVVTLKGREWFGTIGIGIRIGK